MPRNRETRTTPMPRNRETRTTLMPRNRETRTMLMPRNRETRTKMTVPGIQVMRLTRTNRIPTIRIQMDRVTRMMVESPRTRTKKTPPKMEIRPRAMIPVAIRQMMSLWMKTRRPGFCSPVKVGPSRSKASLRLVIRVCPDSTLL